MKDKKEPRQSTSGTKLPHTNGNSSVEHYSDRMDLDYVKSIPREPDRGLGESRPALPAKSSTASGRKATVSPGPWKIPGSDKLPSALRSGMSTLSR